jgi:hypothetical protein
VLHNCFLACGVPTAQWRVAEVCDLTSSLVRCQKCSKMLKNARIPQDFLKNPGTRSHARPHLKHDKTCRHHWHLIRHQHIITQCIVYRTLLATAFITTCTSARFASSTTCVPVLAVSSTPHGLFVAVLAASSTT